MFFLAIAPFALSPVRTASSLSPNSPRQQLLYAAAHDPSKMAFKAYDTALHLIFKNPVGFDLSPSELIAPYLREPISTCPLSENAIKALQSQSTLKNRTLLGHSISSIDEIKNLKSEEIDLSRALFLIQYKNDIQMVESEEANLDLLAYEILHRAGDNPTPEQLVYSANELVFFELGFRFPALKEFQKEVDRFSLLSSVLASRRGICLGVSTLYLCLAQRIGLTLEVFTPPGHIFIAYTNSHGEKVGIETTCRGVAFPLESYLNVHLKYLKPRTYREVIGMSYFNLASTYLRTKEWKEAENLYTQALTYCPEERESTAFRACCQIMQDKTLDAKNSIARLKSLPSDDLISLEPLFFDLCNNSLNPTSIELILQPVDENFESYRKRIEDLKSIKPINSSLLQQLAAVHIELGQYRLALNVLSQLHTIHPEHVPTLFYQAYLYLIRADYPNATNSATQLLAQLQKINHFPKSALQLFETLDLNCGTRYLNSCSRGVTS